MKSLILLCSFLIFTSIKINLFANPILIKNNKLKRSIQFVKDRTGVGLGFKMNVYHRSALYRQRHSYHATTYDFLDYTQSNNINSYRNITLDRTPLININLNFKLKDSILNSIRFQLINIKNQQSEREWYDVGTSLRFNHKQIEIGYCYYIQIKQKLLKKYSIKFVPELSYIYLNHTEKKAIYYSTSSYNTQGTSTYNITSNSLQITFKYSISRNFNRNKNSIDFGLYHSVIGIGKYKSRSTIYTVSRYIGGSTPTTIIDKVNNYNNYGYYDILSNFNSLNTKIGLFITYNFNNPKKSLF